jgi:TRAP-type C4-dicarboxylate transport system permease small subunit
LRERCFVNAFGRVLERTSRALALLGGAILVALTGIAVGSIGGRLFGRPILGDFELVQLGCAVAIAFFLPYTQWRRANLIVDFFTVRASRRVQGAMDRVGSLILCAVMALLAWRVGVGALDLRSYQETSIILGLPTWWAYAAISPSFGLTSLVALYVAIEPGPER